MLSGVARSERSEGRAGQFATPFGSTLRACHPKMSRLQPPTPLSLSTEGKGGVVSCPCGLDAEGTKRPRKAAIKLLLAGSRSNRAYYLLSAMDGIFPRLHRGHPG